MKSREEAEPEMTEGELIYWHRGFAMGALSSCDSRLPSQGICSKTLLKLSPAET